MRRPKTIASDMFSPSRLPVPPFPNGRIVPDNLVVARAVGAVVVHDAARLLVTNLAPVVVQRHAPLRVMVGAVEGR